MEKSIKTTLDIVGSGKAEAWANVHHYKEDTNVSVPSEEAVENAKNWIEENKK